MTKEEIIAQTVSQFEAGGLGREAALHYATQQVEGTDYEETIRMLRHIFSGVEEQENGTY